FLLTRCDAGWKSALFLKDCRGGLRSPCCRVNLTSVLIRFLILLLFAAALYAGGYYVVQELYVKPEQKLIADQKQKPPEPPPDPSIAEFARCLELRRTASPREARAAL